MNFKTELQFISSLDIMVSMDSANMHLASLYGVPVVSIWGGTHPYLGFYGWGQKETNAVQIELSCRPSSVFGNKPCYNDLACMKGIAPLMIYDKVMQQLEGSTP
jgi:ADP-heptose:LPS heptosyltransferase